MTPETLRQVLEAILANPHGCPMCDSGVLRESAVKAGKTHWPECPYAQARALLDAPPADAGVREAFMAGFDFGLLRGVEKHRALSMVAAYAAWKASQQETRK